MRMTRQQGAMMLMMKVENVIWYLVLLLLVGNASSSSSSSSSVASLFSNSNHSIIITKKKKNQAYQHTSLSLSSPSSLIFMRGGAATKNLPSKALSSSSSSSSSSSYKKKRIDTKQPSPPPEERTISLRPLLVSSFLMIFALMLTGLSPTPILIDQFGADRCTKILSSIASLGAVLEIILSPIFGSLLDSIGRKSVMVGATLLISVVNMIVAASFLVSSSSSSVVSITLTNAIIVSISKLCNAVFFPTTFIAVSAIVGDVLASKPNKMGSFMALSMSLTSVGMIFGITTAGKLLGGSGSSNSIISSLTQKYNPHGLLYFLSSVIALFSATVIAVGLPETLPKHKRIPFFNNNNEGNTNSSVLHKIKQSPASAARLLLGRGKQIRWLAILLVLQSLPMSMGDIFQVYSRNVWGMDPNDFAKFVATFGGIKFFSTLCSSILIGKKVGMSLQKFTMMAVFSSLFYPIGACFSFKYAMVGMIVGLFASSQSLGVIAQLTAKATTMTTPLTATTTTRTSSNNTTLGNKTTMQHQQQQQPATQGELAGERAALVALTRVIGPILYGSLFVVGNKIHVPQILFGFNALLGLIACSIVFFQRDIWS